MKKILSIVAAMVLTISMAAVSVYAAEADTDEASTQADCLHTDKIVKTVINQELIAINDSDHGLLARDYTCCRICGAILGHSDYYFVNVTKHTLGQERYTYNHSGNYTEHYYVRSQTCGGCGKVVERKGWTGCTAKRCIEPQ